MGPRGAILEFGKKRRLVIIVIIIAQTVSENVWLYGNKQVAPT